MINQFPPGLKERINNLSSTYHAKIFFTINDFFLSYESNAGLNSIKLLY